ncbi:MAG TPA: alpha-mannosidase, partial [Kribbella sp.]
MIGNAHIDAVWLWQWQEGYQEVRATFRSALDRMDEYPDYVFTADSVAYFSWIAEHDPALFDRIRKRVAEHRFEIVGGWWVEPDCNIPGGEAFVRQALYSQRWLAEHLGVIATVGCNVDPFGHNATLPQLLSKSRLDSYAFLRPQSHERELPGQKFWWESADGSRVLAYRIPHEYCSPGGEISGHVTKALQQLPVTTEPLMVFYGVGNHGGGPTIENIESIKQLASRDLFPTMFPSTMRRFFDEARTAADIPVHATELQPHAIGCYAAHSEVKRQNRLAEQLLLAAEKWSTIAVTVGGMPDATPELGHAWKQVLFNQFHDIAAGTAIEPAYDDARDQLGEAKSIAARLANRSIQSISRQID